MATVNRSPPATLHSRADNITAFPRQRPARQVNLERVLGDIQRFILQQRRSDDLHGLEELLESSLVLLDAADNEASPAVENRGVPESAIAKLDRVDDFDGDDDCAICLVEMAGGGCGGRLIRLECKHLFHESCLVSWLRTSNSCPLCRSRVSDRERSN
ncbi:E3 ubiquitin-protein ligase RNF181 homolog [Linum grandiflorum]